MKRLYLAVFVTCSVIAAGIGPVCAEVTEPRVALVVGNAAYRNVAPLKNPVNDARDMAKALRELGFDVIRVEDANKQQLDHAIGEFSSKLSKASVGLFYYSGHGMQENGHNYLIPVDANVATEAAVTLEATDLDLVLTSMAQTRVNLVILDACRNNPFERRFRAIGRGLAPVEQTLRGTLVAHTTAPGKIAADGDGANERRFRALGPGLVPIGQTPRGILIAYSTAPGKIAEDGDGANGLYTAELLKALRVPGLKVEDVFKAVRVAVSAASSDEQIPWELSSLTGDFIFKPAAPSPVAPVAPPTVSPDTADIAFWNSVKADTSLTVFEEYLKEFPNGRFATLAKLKISELSAAQIALKTPATEPVNPNKEFAFHCPRPGTVVYYNTTAILRFSSEDGFLCTYSDGLHTRVEKFAVFSDNAEFLRAGLDKLWPLKIGKELAFTLQVSGHSQQLYVAATEQFKVLRRETLSLPAGEFNTVVVEWEESAHTSQYYGTKRLFWYAPDHGLILKSTVTVLGLPNAGGWGTAAAAGDYEAVRITSAAGASADEAVFHCPQPGTLIEYNDGTSMLFLGVSVFNCTYRKKNKEVGEKFGALVDDVRFVDGLSKLWPLKVGGEQSFNVGAAKERFTVLRRESVEIEAGTFDTFVIEQEESAMGRNGKRIFWYAPDFGLVVQSKFIRSPTRQYGGDTWDFVTIPPGDYEAIRITSTVQRLGAEQRPINSGQVMRNCAPGSCP